MKKILLAGAGAIAALLLMAPSCEGSRQPRPEPSKTEMVGNAPDQPVLGRFCSFDDLNKQRRDAHGRNLVCKRNENGTIVWQPMP